MAKIKPFKGVRPPKNYVTEVASRPYDVLNSEEARIEAEGNEKSLYHIIKPEIDFAPGTIIELNKIAGEPIDVLVNGKYVAKGEVVVIEESFGIRITEIVH